MTQHCGGLGIGFSFSPRPVASAVPPVIQKVHPNQALLQAPGAHDLGYSDARGGSSRAA